MSCSLFSFALCLRSFSPLLCEYLDTVMRPPEPWITPNDLDTSRLALDPSRLAAPPLVDRPLAADEHALDLEELVPPIWHNDEGIRILTEFAQDVDALRGRIFGIRGLRLGHGALAGYSRTDQQWFEDFLAGISRAVRHMLALEGLRGEYERRCCADALESKCRAAIERVGVNNAKSVRVFVLLTLRDVEREARTTGRVSAKLLVREFLPSVLHACKLKLTLALLAVGGTGWHHIPRGPSCA